MKYWVKRLMDMVGSCLGLLILLPVFVILGIWIVMDSRGGVFYRQVRVGLNGRTFRLWKFRTMAPGSDRKLNLTIGNQDSRITRAGGWLRRFKLDELPQLINVLVGEMSLVGPRPEVPHYVAMYNETQRKVLTVKPGITDYASIRYRNENELLARAENPEQFYIEEVMPAKLKLNLDYVENQSVWLDLKLVIQTIIYIFVKG